MNERFAIDAASEVQILVPQQAEFYQAQLRAIANFALQGAGADLGSGSGATQYYLNIAGTPPSNVSSFIWRSPIEAGSANFAVLPPQAFSRQYFGTTASADTEGNKLWVEGIDLFATGSRYSRLLVSYDSFVDPTAKVPIAIGAFIDHMRANLAAPDTDQKATTVVGLAQTTHRRLGNALLSFWSTTAQPPDLASENFSRKGAYDISNLILRRQIELAKNGHPDGRHDSVTLLGDARGNTVGFIGEDLKNRMTSVLVRNATVFPDRIDYITLPTPGGDTDDNVIVTHYAISRTGVSTRLCILSSKEVEALGIAQLISKIQSHHKPLDILSPDEVTTVVRGLHAELGDLLGKGGGTALPTQTT